MASIKTRFTVGLFVLTGLGCAVVVIIWLGMSNYFEKGYYYVAYFDESVQGLDKDSPVKYRGVSIGRVDSVSVAPDATLIQVILIIETGLQLEDDMVAQLKSIGITGIMFVELDRRKKMEQKLPPELSFAPEYQVIATKPSEIKKFIGGINDVLKRLNALDLEEISNSSIATINSINQAVENAQTKKISSDIMSLIARAEIILNTKRWDNIIALIEKTSSYSYHVLVNTGEAVSGFNKAISRIDTIIANNEKGFNEAVSDFKGSLKSTDIFFKSGARLMKNTDTRLYNLQRDLFLTLKNLEKSSENLRQLTELLADQPSQLIFGQPVPPRNPESDR